MFRTVGDQESLWEAMLPDEVRRLPEELARIDALLDDEVFYAPFVPFFDPWIGRPSTPVETYLRLMFLKFRYRLGYQSLCREVADSIAWRRFCRIPLDGAVPHTTTLMKLTTRCGSAAVDGLNEALLVKAAEAKLLRTTRVRADTTVIPANVSYPTDSGLLAKAIRRIAATGRRIQAAGGATRTRLRDRSRSAGKLAYEVGSKLRLRAADGKDEAHAAVRRVTGELAQLADKAAHDAERLLANANVALRGARAKAQRLKESGEHDATAGRLRGRLARAINDLNELLTATRKIALQTRQRLIGKTPDGATRRVSLHDPHARPIRKGRLGKPVEFGYKAQVVDNDDGIVLDHDVAIGNPPDAPRLAPAIKRLSNRAARPPRTVTADRGYGDTSVDDDLHQLGVRDVHCRDRHRRCAVLRQWRLITVADLYEHVYERTRAAESRQTPALWSIPSKGTRSWARAPPGSLPRYGAEGKILVAHSPRGAVVTPIAPRRSPSHAPQSSTTGPGIRGCRTRRPTRSG